MIETIVAFINGAIVLIDVIVSEETRTIDGDEYHLVVNQSASGHKSLCTKENLRKARASVAESQTAMTELEATL